VFSERGKRGPPVWRGEGRGERGRETRSTKVGGQRATESGGEKRGPFEKIGEGEVGGIRNTRVVSSPGKAFENGKKVEKNKAVRGT